MIEQIIDRLELLIEENIISCGEENSLMCHDRNFGVIQAIECIKKMEKQPKTDWIPCEVEMPKTNGVYQTVRKVMEGDRVCYLEGASYFDGQNTWHNDIGVNHGREYLNVVAWQPIQPYKKKGNSNENT